MPGGSAGQELQKYSYFFSGGLIDSYGQQRSSVQSRAPLSGGAIRPPGEELFHGEETVRVLHRAERAQTHRPISLIGPEPCSPVLSAGRDW